MTHSIWKTAIKAVMALAVGISLSACSEKDPENPFEGKPEKTNPTTLSDVNSAEAGTSFTNVECLTVVAANSQGIIL